jgi:hypothetical protein
MTVVALDEYESIDDGFLWLGFTHEARLVSMCR